MKENGGGGSKKDAKREAAQKMIDKLKSLGPTGPEQVILKILRMQLEISRYCIHVHIVRCSKLWNIYYENILPKFL